MQRSPIEWTNFTSNPLRYRDKDGNIVHACIHASTGCLKCYSEVMAGRWGRAGKKFTAANMEGLTPFLDEKELHSILTYKPAAGQMCFLGDMTDIFGQWVPFELLDELFAVMALRPDVTFQILTKRAERMREYWASVRVRMNSILTAAVHISGQKYSITDFIEKANQPLPNVWLGVSVENQKYADERIPLLLQTPAAVRFVSYEPALGLVDFKSFLLPHYCINCAAMILPRACPVCGQEGQFAPRLDWIICGGESGPGARPFNIQWARDVVRQCRAAGVASFVKQMGSVAIMAGCRQNHWDWGGAFGYKPHFSNYSEDPAMWRIHLKSSKGGDPLEWAEDLRVRQYPPS